MADEQEVISPDELDSFLLGDSQEVGLEGQSPMGMEVPLEVAVSDPDLDAFLSGTSPDAKKDNALKALTMANSAPSIDPPGLGVESLSFLVNRKATLDTQLESRGLSEQERIPLIVEKEEIEARLDEAIKFSAKRDEENKFDFVRTGQRMARDAARDYLSLSAAAGTVKAASGFLPPLLKPVGWGVGFLVGMGTSGITEVALEKAGDLSAGEQPEDPTFLGTMNQLGLNPLPQFLQAPNPEEDPTWDQALVRGFEEFLMPQMVDSGLKSVKPLAREAAVAYDKAIEDFGGAIVGKVDDFGKLKGKGKVYENFKQSLNTLLHNGYMENMATIVKGKMPSYEQIVKMAESTGIPRPALKQFYKDVVSNPHALSVGSFNGALTNLYGTALRDTTRSADNLLSHYIKNVAGMTARKAKATKEFAPDWSAMRERILKDMPAAVRAKAAPKVNSIIQETRKGFMSHRGGMLEWATDEKSKLYQRINHGRSKIGPTTELAYQEVARGLKNYVNKMAEGLDGFVYSVVTEEDIPLSAGLKSSSDKVTSAGFQFPERTALPPGGDIPLEIAGEARLGIDAPAPAGPRLLTDKYSLPGPTTPIRTDLPAKYKYQVIKRPGTEVLEDLGGRTFEYVDGKFVEIENFEAGAAITEEAAGRLLFRFESGQNKTSFHKNLAALNERYGAVQGVSGYVDKNQFLDPLISEWRKKSMRLVEPDSFAAGIFGSNVMGVAGTAAGMVLGGPDMAWKAGLTGAGLGQLSYQAMQAARGATKQKLRKAAIAANIAAKASPYSGKIPRNVAEILADTKISTVFSEMVRSSAMVAQTFGANAADVFELMNEQDQEQIMQMVSEERQASFENPPIPGAFSYQNGKLKDPMERQYWITQLGFMGQRGDLPMDEVAKAKAALNRDGSFDIENIFSPKPKGEAKKKVTIKPPEPPKKKEIKVTDELTRASNPEKDGVE